MQWSKTKKMLESFLCEKLIGRVHIYAAVYRKFHDQPGRVWITFDKNEIVSAADVTYMIKHEVLYQQIQNEKELKPIPFSTDFKEMLNSPERQALSDAFDDAEDMLFKQGEFATYHLYRPFMSYNTLSIEEALSSENPIVQAYSMFDRRLGKRRLQSLEITTESHPLVKRFYDIRCNVEGMGIRNSS